MPGPPAPDRRRPARLWALGALEAVTFLGLLVVVVAGHDQALVAGAGFVHGCVYLASLFVAWRLADDGHALGVAVVPGVGGLLFARAVTGKRPG